MKPATIHHNNRSIVSYTSFAWLTVGLTASFVPRPVLGQCVLQEQAKLIASDAGAFDSFGSSVAVSGDIAVVGASLDDHAGGSNAGSAYVFIRSGTVWTQQAKLMASDAAANDQFGNGVVVDGNSAVVGAWLDDHAGGTDAGSAYVFERSGAVWTQQAKLSASDGATNDQFGFSLSINADTIVVGAHADDGLAGNNQGSAYVFVRDGGGWGQHTKLIPLDAAANDQFGFSVALSGDTIVVGAYQDHAPAGSNQGCAYVFLRDGGVWTQQAKLTASDAADLDNFGNSVAISGNTAIIGAQRDNHAGGTLAGSAYVYVRSSGVWTQQTKLTASDAASNHNFGTSVSLTGDTALVGAVQTNAPPGSNFGTAYVFVRSVGVWNQQAKLVASDGAAVDSLGSSVAVSGDTALVGASLDNHEGGTDAGSAYVFDLGCPPDNTPPIANDQTVTTAKNTSIAIELTATDADGDVLQYSLVTTPSHGSLIGFDPIAGTVTYDPNGPFAGTDSFTFKVNDGEVDSNIATVRASVGGGLLYFPLRGLTPYTARIASVFDHSLPTNCPDGKVIPFTNEDATQQVPATTEPPVDATGGGCTGEKLFSYTRPGGFPLLVSQVNYTGTILSGNTVLNYDGHTGYDYPMYEGTEVYAAADGTADYGPAGYGQINIDHHNEFTTHYLHLKTRLVMPGQTVVGGQTIIGLVGDEGTQEGSFHLHFTVKYHGQRIDPYGWIGPGSSPCGCDQGVLWRDSPNQ